MKKITCFLFVLLLSAIYSINASANHSKFINTWVGYAIPLNESDIIGFVTPVIALKNDNTGSYSFLIDANFKIDNKTSIDIKLAGNIPYKWTLDENNILVMHLDKDKFYIFMEKVGNTVSSTIPIALCEARKEDKLHGRVLLAGFGVGLSWGGVMLKID